MEKRFQLKKTFWLSFLCIFPALFLAFPNFANAQGVSYSSLRIVVGPNNTTINTLTMRTDQGDTMLNVQGQRSDDGLWESISATWSIVPALRTSTVPPLSSSWKFTPIDTGAALIIVSKAGSMPDTVHAYFISGLPNSLVLYPSPGAPGGANLPLLPPTNAIVDTAGKPLQMVAKIFDKNGIWLGSYDRASAPVSWSIVELTGNPPTGALNNAAGFTSAYTPTRAYNSLYVIARLDSTGLTPTARDTIKISVGPGAPSQLVIEADPNWQTKPTMAVPVDSIRIAATQMSASVYALIRDKFGNFVKYSIVTKWGSFLDAAPLIFDSSIVSVHNGTIMIGEGIVRRVAASGFERVYAASGEFTGLADTIKAIVAQYHYLQLMIVTGNDTSTQIKSLTMNTDQDTTLKVIGLRSDVSEWEPAGYVKWEISSGLNLPANQTPPASAHQWSFSPNAPGSGWIRVTLGNDAVTRPDTIQVIFTTSPQNTIISAITRDDNGNGYLDRIDLHFYGRITIPARGVQSTFTGTYNDPIAGSMVTYATCLTVDSVVSKNGTGTDSLFSVYLVEPMPGVLAYGYPQTGWTPTISISGIGASAHSIKCVDGAGPVVWSVVKTINTVSDRTKDLVTVTFSEPIQSGANSFSLVNQPTGVFRVWQRKSSLDGKDTLVESLNMLDSIASFFQIDPTKTQLSFYMTNNHDLNTSHFINLVWNDSAIKLSDNGMPPNLPAEDNRIVQIKVIVPGSVVPGLQRPTAPTISLIFRNSQSIVFPLSQSILHSNLSLSLYDLSGRVVCRIKNLDITKPIVLNSSVRPGVCCMRLCADGKTIVQRRLLFAK
jgi:hypothetical protein